MIALVPALAGALIVAGIIGVMIGLRPSPEPEKRPASRRVPRLQNLDRTSRLLLLGGLGACPDPLGQRVQVHVARGDIAGQVGDGDEGLVNILFGQPHGIEIAALGRAFGPFGHMAAGQPGFVEAGRGGNRWAP